MPVSETIKRVKLKEEFVTCPVCGHDSGFSTSLQHHHGDVAKVVLICPECGARFDIGWEVALH